MSIFQAAVLGIVQGLTEFIPVSSSAHLVLARELFAWKDTGLLFDVVIHLGTLLAAIIYFWGDIKKIALAFFEGSSRFSGDSRSSFGTQGTQAARSKKRLFLNLIIATIPGVVLGVLFKKMVATVFRDIVYISAFLIIIGIVFFVVEYIARSRPSRLQKDMEQITFGDAAVIGLAQGAALLPGISRSGSTISAGLLRGMKRDEATRFSFLMSLPIIAGAGLDSLLDFLKHGDGTTGLEVFIGFLFSAIFGYISITFLIRYLKKHSLNVFGVYVIAAGVFFLIRRFL